MVLLLHFVIGVRAFARCSLEAKETTALKEKADSERASKRWDEV